MKPIVLDMSRAKALICGAFEILQGGGLTEPCSTDELRMSLDIEVTTLFREAMAELEADGFIARTGDKDTAGRPFFRLVRR